jgi:hypothetical protein
MLGAGAPDTGEPFVEQVLAAVGFPSIPPPARRGVLSDDLFESPQDDFPAQTRELSDIIPKVVIRSPKDKQVAGPSAPRMSLPYPFATRGAQVSSADKVPFPPSPVHSGSRKSKKTTSSGVTSGTTSGATSSSGTTSGSTDDDEEEDEEDDDDDDEEHVQGDNELSEEPSTGRASGSMSSLGHPVTSRYPFQFRLPPQRTSMSSGGAPSHLSPTTQSRSMNSRISQGTQSTGNRESTDSHSPRSHTTSDSDVASISPSGFPLPPRFSQQMQGRGRPRSGSVPVFNPVISPSPIAFPTSGRPRAQTSLEAEIGNISQSLSGHPELGHELVDDHHGSESSHEAAEREDIVGLLSPSRASSPRTSLLHRASHHRLRGTRSRSSSNSRTNSQSGSSSSRSRTDSLAASVRSRAQSMMQNIGAASHSSLELVQTAIRSRANSSMARLEEDSPYSSDARTHSRSGSASTNENYTFGHPLRLQRPALEQRLEEEPSESSAHSPKKQQPSSPSQLQLYESHSSLSVGTPSSHPPSEVTSQLSEDTTRRLPTPVRDSSPETEYHSLAPTETEAIDIPVQIRRQEGARDDPISSVASSPPDISTAAESFITVPPTVVGSTESGGERTASSWGDITYMVDRADSAWRPA